MMRPNYKAIGLFSHNVYYVKLRVPYNKFMGLQLYDKPLLRLVDD